MDNKIYLLQFKVNDDKILVSRIKLLFTSWMNYFGHSWIIQTPLSAKEIYDKLSVGYENDSMFIIELKADHWGRMDPKVWDWLKKYVR